VADGFDEVETMGVVSALREAGLCVRILGVMGGVIEGKYGVVMLPDATLVDFHQSIEPATLNSLVLPGGQAHVNRLQRDPRVHMLVRRVVDGGGWVALPRCAYHIAKRALGYDAFVSKRDQMVIWESSELPISSVILDWMRRLEPVAPLNLLSKDGVDVYGTV
jgi:hypothetical protein